MSTTTFCRSSQCNAQKQDSAGLLGEQEEDSKDHKQQLVNNINDAETYYHKDKNENDKEASTLVIIPKTNSANSTFLPLPCDMTKDFVKKEEFGSRLESPPNSFGLSIVEAGLSVGRDIDADNTDTEQVVYSNKKHDKVKENQNKKKNDVLPLSSSRSITTTTRTSTSTSTSTSSGMNTNMKLNSTAESTFLQSQNQNMMMNIDDIPVQTKAFSSSVSIVKGATSNDNDQDNDNENNNINQNESHNISSSLFLSAVRNVFSNNSKKHEDGTPQFLLKTYRMLEKCTENPFDQKFVCWTKRGDSFLIKDPEIFASDIIPKYFSHNNFQSFVRQLNFYGFRKVNTGTRISRDKKNETGKVFEFKHEKFVRGKLHLCNQIKRATHALEKHTLAAEKELKEVRSQNQELKTQIQNLQSKIEYLLKEQGQLLATNKGQVDAITQLHEINQRLQSQYEMCSKSSQIRNRQLPNLASIVPGQHITTPQHFVEMRPQPANDTTHSTFSTSSASPIIHQGANSYLPGPPLNSIYGSLDTSNHHYNASPLTVFSGYKPSTPLLVESGGDSLNTSSNPWSVANCDRGETTLPSQHNYMIRPFYTPNNNFHSASSFSLHMKNIKDQQCEMTSPVTDSLFSPTFSNK